MRTVTLGTIANPTGYLHALIEDGIPEGWGIVGTDAEAKTALLSHHEKHDLFALYGEKRARTFPASGVRRPLYIGEEGGGSCAPKGTLETRLAPHREFLAKWGARLTLASGF